MYRSQVVAIIFSVIMLISILNLIIKRKLKEEYALLWLFLGSIIFLLSVWRNLLFFITGLIGVADANTTLFFFGILYLLIFILHFSIKISLLEQQNKRLIQDAALLKKEVNDLKSQKDNCV